MSNSNYSLLSDSVQWQEYRFHQHLRWLDQLARWARPRNKQADCTAFGKRIETLAGDILADRGHSVHQTTYKAPFDLWAGGLKVEVKGAHWTAKQGGKGRYQACIRNHRADVYLLACADGGHQVVGWFIIPAEAIGDKANVTITHPDPGQYAGQWAQYYQAWDILDGLVRRAGEHPQQLRLWG